MYGMVPKNRREKLREITAFRYVATGGDWEQARPLIEQDIRECGSILMWLTVISVLMQIAYTAFKFWKERNAADPVMEVWSGEPFGIN